MRSLFRATLGGIVTMLLVVGSGISASDSSSGTGLLTGPDLTLAIREQLALEKGSYRVSVRELGGANRSVDIDSGHSMEPASSIKVFYAWLALRRVDSGRLSLDSLLPSRVSWRKCLEVMILVSDNLCSSDIRESLGNRRVNRALANSGFGETRILLSGSGQYLGKRSSASDLAEFFVRLERGELLSAGSSTVLHSLLREQVWRSRIGGGIPPGVVIESKPGQLAVSGRMVETDAAIVRGPRSTYVITVMGDNNATRSAIRNVSQIVYEGLQGESVLTRATYPRAQFTARRDIDFRAHYGGLVTARIPAGRPVKLKFTSRRDAFVHVDGFGWGWVHFNGLRLSSAYRWE